MLYLNNKVLRGILDKGSNFALYLVFLGSHKSVVGLEINPIPTHPFTAFSDSFFNFLVLPM